MAQRSSIEWTDATWNPLRGCSRVSEGCRNCLTPETPILYADMVWRPIGGANVGDVLLAFDESNIAGEPRKFRPATILAKWESKKRTVRLVAEKTEIFTTAEHRWLTANSNRWVYARRENPTQGIRVGTTTLRSIGMIETISVTTDYRVGYLVGMTLGDGTFRYELGQRSDKLGFAQAYWRVALQFQDEVALGRLVSYLAYFGIVSHIRPFDGGRRSGAPMLKVEIRSLRALEKLNQILRLEIDSQEFRRGFLAGFFDAEGSGSDSLRVSQKDRGILRRFASYAASMGFQFDLETQSGERASSARLRGSLLERIRFFGVCQPTLIRKNGLYGLRMQQEPERILALETGCLRDMVDIRTSTGTFYASGIATHNCYAEAVAARFSGPGQPYEGLAVMKSDGPHWTGKVRLIESALDWPLRWRGSKAAAAEGRKSRIFVNSMSDLFHESVPDEWIDRIFAVMALCPQYAFQVLTKRVKRMADYMLAGKPLEAAVRMVVRTKGYIFKFDGLDGKSTLRWRLPNVWLGVSVEDQPTADERILLLLRTPAAVHWVSYEPALGPVDFERTIPCGYYCDETLGHVDHGPNGRLGHLDWIVAGGESGALARPCHVEWLRRARDQSKAAGVPIFIKQLGRRPVLLQHSDGAVRLRLALRDRKGGDWNEWPADLRVREFPQ